MKCPFCQDTPGFGFTPCRECDGMGGACMDCNGGGCGPCPYCYGRAYVATPADCPTCNGTGERECSACLAVGTIPFCECEACGDNGYVDCTRCEGTGYLPLLDYHQKFGRLRPEYERLLS